MMLSTAGGPALGKIPLHSRLAAVNQAFQRRCVCTHARGSAALRELSELRQQEDVPTVKTLEWDGPLTINSILKYPHPKLRAPNARVAVFGEPLKKLVAEMFEVMYQDKGVGLAAPQVGVNLRLMVFNEEGERGKGEELVFVNPIIQQSSPRQVLMEEGCLSFPNVGGHVSRPDTIKIKAQDVEGKTVRFKISGFAARVFQHEFDHLQGVLFHDRFAPDVLEKNRGALVALEEKFLSANPGVAVQRIS